MDKLKELENYKNTKEESQRRITNKWRYILKRNRTVKTCK